MPLFPLIMSAIWSMVGFALRSVVVKFATLFALFFIVEALIEAMQSAGLFPTSAGLSSAFGGLPGDVWYFLNLANISYGFPLILSAYVTRFMIRRIPVVG